MNLHEKREMKCDIRKLVDDNFEWADIKFVLIKPEKERYDYIIGVSSFEGEYIFMPYHKTSIIAEDSIQYKRKYRELFDECIEGHVLLMLEKGYTVFSMDIYFHYQMWDFIDYFNNEVFEIPLGLNTYLSYCKNNGITRNLIENETFEMVDDIITDYLENVIDNYNIALSETVGTKRTVLGYKWNLNLCNHEVELIYRVMTIDLSTSQIISENYHDKIDNAYKDYLSRFFNDSLIYYSSLDNKNRVLVEQLKKRLEGKDDGNG